MTRFELRVRTPLGELRLLASEVALTGLYLPGHEGAALGPALDGAGHPVLRAARAQLDEYFHGERMAFDLPLALEGTLFQRAVWEALTRIPFGETRTYGELAVSLGKPRAARAMGAANARNPISIIVPCHRVVGAGGKLAGYAGGVEAKRWLLAHEQRALSTKAPRLPAQGELFF